ncbi:MAG TPA: class I SAM-dependent methyltransferase [Candidatus Methylomirabilis sp.]|nr:class I SAM-dependent methyltransferase [Candidatus Methylomirabilis sp.]
MTLYERGNAAKQWMLEYLERRFGSSNVRVLDLACGNGKKWSSFIESHSAWQVIGVDTDTDAIAAGKRLFEGKSQVDLRVFDAQHLIEEGTFDACVAMSAIEHVVDRPAFLNTVWTALKPGGVALLNYDAGHFRSSNWKEQFMVPASQLLAVFGIEGPYMKRVDDEEFRRLAEAKGFRVVALRKHNLGSLKGFMRGASDDAVRVWYGFEDQMGLLFTPEQLDRVMWSTTLVLEKP